MTEDTSLELAHLDYQTFEMLVGLLLDQEGYAIQRTPQTHEPSASGSLFEFDFEARSPTDGAVYVEVKHFRRSPRLPTSTVTHFLGELARVRQQHPDAQGLLATSGELTPQAEASLKEHSVSVWTGLHILNLVRKHPEVLPPVQHALHTERHRATVFETLKSPGLKGLPFSSQVAERLAKVPPGKADWRRYEDTATEILTKLFTPDLGAPDVQSRSEDGLDIIDAVFPIRAITHPWALVRTEYRTRFVVAEYKNYTDPVTQKGVESIAQYLFDKAFRLFGLLVSRKQPSESALTARRRAWTESGKLIVILSDTDLVDMAQLWEEKGDPFQVIDAQLEEFFRRLNP